MIPVSRNPKDSTQQSVLYALRAGVGALIAAVIVATGCVPPEELDGNDLEPTMEWDEFVRHDLTPVEPSRMTFIEDVALTPESLSALPEPVRRDPRAARLAVSRTLGNPEAYWGGVLGVLGTSKMFVADRSRLPGYDRLYGIMVRVLSEKYSCLMRSKWDRGAEVRFRCRDGRQVVFHRALGPDWIQFSSRQFDAEGYEIIVQRRQIIRISDQRVI